MHTERTEGDKQEAVQQEARIAALQSERDDLKAALDAPIHNDPVTMAEYGRFVETSAQAMAERDNHPMPKSVTTREEFYEVMAGAALEAISLTALLERVPRAERQLQTDRAQPVAPRPTPGRLAERGKQARHVRRRLRPHRAWPIRRNPRRGSSLGAKGT
jgi:hypothetical protein